MKEPDDRGSTGKSGHAFFDTPLGRCAVGWTDLGIRRVALPEAGPDDVAAFPPECRAESSPPPAVARAVAALIRSLSGAPCRLPAAPLDLSGVGDFRLRVYEALREVPPGATVTYGELARRAGAPNAARAVGRAMATNPLPLLIPCHRVLASGGRLGGFAGAAKIPLKARLLELEGARFAP